MPNDGTVYRPLGYTYGLEVPPGGGGGGGGGVGSGLGQVQAMRTEWWWQPGPVTSCCWFFSLRTGVYLLALWNMISGVEYLRVDTKIPWLIEKIARDREQYKASCAGHVVIAHERCEAIMEKIAYREKVLDFWQSSIPAYHTVGALLVLFALVGWRAGYTSSPAVAKVFVMAFPAALSLRVALLVLPPHQTVWVGLVAMAVTFAYFFKVAWSFYARVRMVAEANQLADEMDLPRPTVSSTRSDTNNAGDAPLDASNA